MAADDTTPPARMQDAEPPGGPTATQSASGLPNIVPAPGSEAMVTQAASTGPVVNYYFPVEVELIGGDLDDTTVRRVVAGVFAELDRELSSRL